MSTAEIVTEKLLQANEHTALNEVSDYIRASGID